ncbi:MAG: (2Fe-2S)-binding protein [Planctomycetota bacterium]
MTGKRVLKLRINGSEHEVGAVPSALLLDVLRNDLNLVGTKRGCDMGTCGCCNVLLDGRPVMSCLVLAFDCVGREVTTIEGLADPADGRGLHPLQRAWAEHGGSQCGFCSPGFIVTAKALLDEEPDPDEGRVREALAGNLCRCTGYKKIVEAVLDAAAVMRGGDREEVLS